MTREFKIIGILLLIFLPILIVIFYFLHSLDKKLAHNQILKNLEQSYFLLEEVVNDQAKLAQSIAFGLSVDEIIINSLKNHKPDDAYNFLLERVSKIKQNLLIPNLLIQIHTKELKSFVRNWDKNGSGVALEAFREGLKLVKETKRPISGIELGKRLNIKAIVPIFDDKQYLGSIEAIFDFEGLEKKLAQFEIIPIVLLEKDLINIAVDEKDKPEINGYKLINQACKKECFYELKEGFNGTSGVIVSKKYAFGFKELYSYSYKKIGKLGVAIKINQNLFLENENKLE